MKKKIIVWVAILLVVIIGLLIYNHYIPVWVSISNVISFIVGAVLGILFELFLQENEIG